MVNAQVDERDGYRGELIKSVRGLTTKEIVSFGFWSRQIRNQGKIHKAQAEMIRKKVTVPR